MIAPEIVGILLAAGRGARFGGDKLLAITGSEPNVAPSDFADLAGECIGVAACRRLLRVLPRVVAVVRPGDAALAAALGAAGARIVRCPNSDDGMGASLACGVAATKDAAGWVVALGDSLARIDVDDAGTLRDVDRPADLQSGSDT